MRRAIACRMSIVEFSRVRTADLTLFCDDSVLKMDWNGVWPIA